MSKKSAAAFKAILVTLLAYSGALNIGYYHYLVDVDLERVWFIKKYPTLQIKFYNLYADESDGIKLDRLSIEERGLVIDYCKYRLGIVTKLKTEEDLERCKVGQYRSEF